MLQNSLNPEALKKKASALTALLATHSQVHVHVSTKNSAVIVPTQLRDKSQVVFTLGLALIIPVDDLIVTEYGWSAILSFNRIPFRCSVPWEAVFVIVADSGIGSLWEEDIPDELKLNIANAKVAAENVHFTQVAPTEQKHPSSKLPTGWTVLDGGKK